MVSSGNQRHNPSMFRNREKNLSVKKRVKVWFRQREKAVFNNLIVEIVENFQFAQVSMWKIQCTRKVNAKSLFFWISFWSAITGRWKRNVVLNWLFNTSCQPTRFPCHVFADSLKPAGKSHFALMFRITPVTRYWRLFNLFTPWFPLSTLVFPVFHSFPQMMNKVLKTVKSSEISRWISSRELSPKKKGE